MLSSVLRDRFHLSADAGDLDRAVAAARDAVAELPAAHRHRATGLSEPSIWVGGMMLHKQYVTPFAPQNSLAKLIEEEKAMFGGGAQ